jgi:ABC-2 type transporter
MISSCSLTQVSLLFFSGFLFRFDDIPGWWQWYAYLDVLRYACASPSRSSCLLAFCGLLCALIACSVS